MVIAVLILSYISLGLSAYIAGYITAARLNRLNSPVTPRSILSGIKGPPKDKRAHKAILMTPKRDAKILEKAGETDASDEW